MSVTAYKQLRRPLDDRIVAGVCSGIGRYFEVDPVLIRVAFAIFAAGTWGVHQKTLPGTGQEDTGEILEVDTTKLPAVLKTVTVTITVR